MKKINQQGFSAIEVLLIIVVVGLLAAAGWLVYDRTKHSKTLPTSSTTSTTASNTKTETSKTPTDSTKYLEIKEWGIKIPLNNTISGAYYQVRAKNVDDPAEYIDLFDSGFDATINKNGKTCKDPAFPLYVIGRVKNEDLGKVEGLDKQGYKKLAISDVYLFNGAAASQSAPKCADLNTGSGNFNEDTNVTTVLSQKKDGFTDSYAKIAKL